MIKPDFKNGLINLSATLADFIGDKNNIPKLDWLEEILKKAPKKVVLIIFDGLGVYNINKLTTENSFYKEHIKSIISSTMPATTTNATTTLSSTKLTDEHLWVAWSLWLKEYKRVLEIYLGTDYYTHEKVGKYDMPFENFIDRAKTTRQIKTIAPSYAHYSNKIESVDANNIDELFDKLNYYAQEKNDQFIYCYCDEPDQSMHKFGPNALEVKEKFETIQTKLENFINKNKELLVITTADHGHIEIKDYIHINDDKEIMSLQARPISMEPRFASFKIKKGCKKQFEKLFNSKYGKYFELVTSKELLKNNVFGFGKNKNIMTEYLGDFVAIGNESFYGLNAFERKTGLFKGAHAGGTKEEMEIPICIFEN